MTKEKKRNLYEVIQAAPATGVRFYTSVDEGSYIPAHWHQAIEIIYLLEGELFVTVESTERLLTPGDCVLINSDIIHATKCTSPNRAILLQIPLDFIEVYITNIKQLLFTLDDSTDNLVRQTKILQFKETLTQMQIVNEIRPEGFLLRFNSLLFELLYQLYHNFSVQIFQADFNQKTKDLARLTTVLNYTSLHYDRLITIEEIARVAFLQPGYFCRFFKKCMGITFLEYQNEIRLSYIYRDLITTQDTVQQILERHGFTNYKLFRRMFSQHFHATPTEIRKGTSKVSP